MSGFWDGRVKQAQVLGVFTSEDRYDAGVASLCPLRDQPFPVERDDRGWPVDLRLRLACDAFMYAVEDDDPGKARRALTRIQERVVELWSGRQERRAGSEPA